MGTGNFFGMVPDSMKDTALYGVELDSSRAGSPSSFIPRRISQWTGSSVSTLPITGLIWRWATCPWQLHMAIEQAVFDAQDRFSDFEMFRDWLKIGSAWVVWVPGPKAGLFFTEIDQLPQGRSGLIF